MKQFILIKTNCYNNLSDVVAVEEITDEEHSYLLIHDHLLKDLQQYANKDDHQSVIVDKDIIHVYKRNGYISNSKILIFIYQIINFED